MQPQYAGRTYPRFTQRVLKPSFAPPACTPHMPTNQQALQRTQNGTTRRAHHHQHPLLYLHNLTPL